MANAMSFARLAMLPLVAIPLAGRPRHLSMAATVLAAAATETGWVVYRARTRHSLRDRALVWGDVVFCALFNIVVTWIDPLGARKIRSAVVSYSLASAGFVGFGLGPSIEGVAAVGLLAGTWAVTTPAVDSKLASDLVGFVLWYGVTVMAGREFRTMGRQLADAEAETIRLHAEAAERKREADVARQREITHREIHDHLLPIVDMVAAGASTTEPLVRMAGREASRARRLILDPRVGSSGGFEAMMTDVVDTYVDAGLNIVPVLSVTWEPPPDVVEVTVGAAREALRNILKYAQGDIVNVFAEAAEGHLETVVRDRGAGFDAGEVQPGGGFTGTYEAVRRAGGTCVVESAPGEGTKVTIRWPAAGDPAGGYEDD